MSHTKDQWIVDPNSDVCVLTDGRYIEAHAASNARLIAAAPELLEASQLLIRYLTELDEQDNPFARAMERAIAKATGGSNE